MSKGIPRPSHKKMRQKWGAVENEKGRQTIPPPPLNKNFKLNPSLHILFLVLPWLETRYKNKLIF